MKICFIMYPWTEVVPASDSTLRIVHEAALRGHTVAIATPNSLTMRGNLVYGFCDVLQAGSVSDKTENFHRSSRFRSALLPMAGFDVIIMRAEPPLNLTTLNFLDSIKRDTSIINDIDGLRVANNKLYAASFDQDTQKFIPTTHVSKNKEYLYRMFKESPADKMVLKPLDGFGGRGVIVLQKSALENVRSLLDFYTDGPGGSNYVILQDYVEGAEEGDVRVLMLGGQPIGAMRRIPASGDMRSNVHAGGEVCKHQLSKEERKLCATIGPQLVRDGLFFVGVDIIRGRLIEVNVLSPGGIARINRLNRTRLQRQVLDYIERMVNTREWGAVRKRELGREIDVLRAQ